MDQTVILFAGLLDGGLEHRADPDYYAYYPRNEHPVIIRGYDTTGNLIGTVRGERRGGEAERITVHLPGDDSHEPKDVGYWRFPAEAPDGTPVTGYRPEGDFNAWLANLFCFPQFIIPYQDGTIVTLMGNINEGINVRANFSAGEPEPGTNYRDGINENPIIRDVGGNQRKLYWRRFRNYGLDGYERPTAQQIHYDGIEVAVKDPDEQHFYLGGHAKFNGYRYISMNWDSHHDLNFASSMLMGYATVRKFHRDGTEIWSVPPVETGSEGALSLHMRSGYLYALQYVSEIEGGRLYLLKIDPASGSVLSSTYTVTAWSDNSGWGRSMPHPVQVVWGPDAVYTANNHDLRMIDYAGNLVASHPSGDYSVPSDCDSFINIPYYGLHSGYYWDGTVTFEARDIGDTCNVRVHDAATFNEISRSRRIIPVKRIRKSATDPDTGVRYIGYQRTRERISVHNPHLFGVQNWQAMSPAGPDLWAGQSMRHEYPGLNYANLLEYPPFTEDGDPQPNWPTPDDDHYPDYIAMVYTDGYGRTLGPDPFHPPPRGGEPSYDWFVPLDVRVAHDMQIPSIPVPLSLGFPTTEGDASLQVPGIPLPLSLVRPDFERIYVGAFRPDVYRVSLGDLTLVPGLIQGRETSDRTEASIVLRAPSEAQLVEILQRRGDTLRIERSPAGLQQFDVLLSVPFRDLRFDRGHQRASATLSGDRLPDVHGPRVRDLSGISSIQGDRVELPYVHPLVRVGDTGMADGRPLQITEIVWSIGPERASMMLRGTWDA